MSDQLNTGATSETPTNMKDSRHQTHTQSYQRTVGEIVNLARQHSFFYFLYFKNLFSYITQQITREFKTVKERSVC